MKISRIFQALLLLVIVCLCAGCTLPGGEEIINPTPVPTPEPTIDPSQPTPEPTETSVVISPSVKEIIKPTVPPTPTPIPGTIEEKSNISKYYLVMNDTYSYLNTERTFDIDVTNVPFIFFFSFDPGYTTKRFIQESSTSTRTPQIEYINPNDGEWVRVSLHPEKTTTEKSTTIIKPEAEFTIEIARIYDDPAEYLKAVTEAGGKERLAANKRLYGDNGIIVARDGYAHGYSSEVEKEIKIYSTGHYYLIVHGHAIDTQIMMFSPVEEDKKNIT